MCSTASMAAQDVRSRLAIHEEDSTGRVQRRERPSARARAVDRPVRRGRGTRPDRSRDGSCPRGAMASTGLRRESSGCGEHGWPCPGGLGTSRRSDAAGQYERACVRRRVPGRTPVRSARGLHADRVADQPAVRARRGDRAGFSTLAELVAAATAHPDTIRFGSSGMGTGTHLGIEQLDQDLGIRTIHIPSVGTDAIADTIGHTVEGRTRIFDVADLDRASAHPRAAARSARRDHPTRRSRILPTVPTLAEAGAPGFDFPIWYGVWAPAGMAVHMAERLANDIHDVLAEPGMRAWISDHDGDPLILSTAGVLRVRARRERASAHAR